MHKHSPRLNYAKFHTAFMICITLALLAFMYVSQIHNDHDKARFLMIIDEEYPGFQDDMRIQDNKADHTYVVPIHDVSPNGEIFGIWLEHRESRIYLDDELKFESREIYDIDLCKSPGSYWALIPISPSDVGKKIRVETVDVYNTLLDVMPDMYLGTQGMLAELCLHNEWTTLVMGIMSIMMSIIFLIFAYILHANREERAGVVYMGLFIGLFGLYRLLDMPFITLMYNDHSLFITCTVLLCYIWTPAVFYLSEAYRHPVSGMYHIIGMAFCTIASIYTFMQVIGVSDLRETVSNIIACMILAFIIIVAENLYSLIRFRHLKESLPFFMMYLIVSLSNFMDFGLYYYSRHTRDSNVTLVVIFAFGLVSGYEMIKETINRNDLLVQQKVELADQRSALMLSQMRPHFVYNTMNTIYALCDSNIEDAKKAIHDFAGYLRHNLGSMEKSDPIAFETELDHTRFYLSIEKMRFGDELNIVYDITVTGFKLPPITLQPIVENAVRHGIRHKEGGGTVKIGTYEYDGDYIVYIEDDGVGFDAGDIRSDDQDKEHNHIALRNVIMRVEQMCEGKVDIKSVPGEGTRVTITIPRKEGLL